MDPPCASATGPVDDSRNKRGCRAFHRGREAVAKVILSRYLVISLISHT